MVALLKQGHQTVWVYVSTRVSGWRRRPWSLHRWGWCTAGSGGSAGENRACWTLNGTGPSLPEPEQDKQHKHLLLRGRERICFFSSVNTWLCFCLSFSHLKAWRHHLHYVLCLRTISNEHTNIQQINKFVDLQPQ